MQPFQPAEEYDIIFCGGGSSACIAAGRLSVANPALKILILEGGPHSKELEEHYIPGKFFTHLRKDSPTVSFHVARPSDHLDGRSVIVASAKCVGGGSSVNWMMYTRGSASDYDDWEKLGNPGWGYADVLPLFKKMETYQVANDLPTHGYSGPLKVSLGNDISNVAHKFLEMAASYDKERESSNTADANELSANSINKYTLWPKWIDSATGRRSNAASYVYEQTTKTGLTVAAGCRIKRVVIQDGKATGVEFIHDRQVYPDAKQDVHFVKAARLVVVSAGAFGSPAILERSGIGSRAILESSGIKQVVDLPGVGESYQDHQCLPSSYLASDEAETLDDLYRGDLQATAAHLEAWKSNGRGSLSKNLIDAGVKYRPLESDLKVIGPDFTPTWKDYFESAPDKAVVWFGITNGSLLPDRSHIRTPKFFSLGAYVFYPVSQGHVHIKSGDVYAPTDFDAAMAKVPADTAVLRWAYKKSREFARRHPFYRGELSTSHPAFPETSKGYTRQYVDPVPYNAPDIEWSKEDDELIDQYVRKAVSTTWHALGTCAMKPRDQNGVVDPSLNVYGVENLKVADLSIAPGNVGANTNSTALLIGEKAAVIIAGELGFEV